MQQNGDGQNKRMNLWVVAIILIILTIFVVGLLSIYWIFSYFLPKILSIFIIILLFKQLGVVVCRFLVFPGYFSLFQRSIETQFGSALAKRSLTYFTSLSELLQYISQKSQKKQFTPNHMDIDKLKTLNEWFQTQIKTYTFIQDRYGISKDQQLYLSELVELSILVNKNQINFKGIAINIDQLLRQPIEFISHIEGRILIQQNIAGSNIEIVDSDSYSELDDHVNRIIAIIQVCLSSSTKDRMNNFFYNSMFGSLDELRAYIEIAQPSQRLNFKSFDGCKLDCMMIQCRDENYQGQPTMLFCNPNGACYESLYHNTQWTQFYLRQGVNVILWNYRGYGYSEGVPNPYNVQRDVEALIDYIRVNLKCLKIGIHGYSLGGQIACQVARSKQLDFLFADRTFMSLSSVGDQCFGKNLGLVFNLLTNWNQNVYQDYIDFQGDKCIAVDTNDEIIPFNASLPMGVATQIFIHNFRKANKVSNSIKFPEVIISYLKKTRFQTSSIQGKSLVKSFYESILVKDEFHEFYLVSNRLMLELINLVNSDPDAFKNAVVQPYVEVESPPKTNRTLIPAVDVTRENFQMLFANRLYRQFFLELFYILSHLDNGFQTFVELYDQRIPTKQSIMGFFIAGHVWMQPSTLIQSWLQFEEKVNKMMMTYSQDNLVSKILKDLRFIKIKTKVILDNLQIQPRDNPDNLIQIFDNQDQRYTKYAAQAIGEVFTVRCGHNGSYNQDETEKFQRIFMNSELMQKQLK